jgi:hypothetical protein
MFAMTSRVPSPSCGVQSTAPARAVVAKSNRWIYGNIKPLLTPTCKCERGRSVPSRHGGRRRGSGRVHESLTPDARHQTTPAMALGLAKHVWSIGDLLDAALAAAPAGPTETAPDRRRRFRVIQGGKAE